MWILLGIVAFLLLLITVILLLPIDVILKTDANGEVLFRYTFLGKTFGEHPDPNNPIAKLLKRITGFDRLDGEAFKKRSADKNLLTAVSESASLILGLLKRVWELLRFGTVKVLHLDVVCATTDAAQTAICYGACHAALEPLLGWIHSYMRVCKRGERIEIRPDFTTEHGSFDFNIVVTFRLFRALIALYRAASDEAKRNVTDSQKTKT